MAAPRLAGGSGGVQPPGRGIWGGEAHPGKVGVVLGGMVLVVLGMVLVVLRRFWWC